MPLQLPDGVGPPVSPKKASERPTEPPPVPPRASVLSERSGSMEQQPPGTTTTKGVNFADSAQPEEEKVEARLKRKNTPHPVKSSMVVKDSQASSVASGMCDSKPSSGAVPNGPIGQLELPSGEQRLKVTVCRTEQGLGLSIAGGLGSTPYKDNDSSIFISKVVEGGPADMAGLHLGDRLLAVNGRSLLNAEHSKAVEVMKLAGTVVQLDISRALPSSPKTVEEPQLRVDVIEERETGNKPFETISTRIKRESSGLGFSVAGGKGSRSNGDDGIFISRITPGGAADRDGKLKVGDKVLVINGVNMNNARHDQAVYLLTGCSSEVLLVVQREKPDSTPTLSPLDKATKKQKIGNEQKIKSSAAIVPSDNDDSNLIEEVNVVKTSSALGLSIVGGIDHSCHPFGGSTGPGIFISKVVADGAAGRTGKLRLGDRLLAVNGKDVTAATHQEAVSILMAPSNEVLLTVRHELLPAGLRELTVTRRADEPLGVDISGGVNTSVHPYDPSDEGIFVSNILPNGAVAKDGRLRIGDRIIEVNNKSFLGVTLQQAADVLNASGSHVHFLVCDGINPVCFSSLQPSNTVRSCNGNVTVASSSGNVVPADASKIPRHVMSTSLHGNYAPLSGQLQEAEAFSAATNSNKMTRSAELPPPVPPKPKIKLMVMDS